MTLSGRVALVLAVAEASAAPSPSGLPKMAPASPSTTVAMSMLPTRRSLPSKPPAARRRATPPPSIAGTTTRRWSNRSSKDFGHIDILVNNAGIASRGQLRLRYRPRRDGARCPHPRFRPALSVEARPRLHAPAAARRHHHDFERRYERHGGQRRPLQHGQSSHGSARDDALQRGAKAQHPRQHRRSRPRRDADGRAASPKPPWAPKTSATSMRACPSATSASPKKSPNAVRFLVSDRAAYLTGQRITVDGGGNIWS